MIDILSDPTWCAVIIAVLSVLIFALKFALKMLSARTGIPTDDVQDAADDVKEAVETALPLKKAGNTTTPVTTQKCTCGCVRSTTQNKVLNSDKNEEHAAPTPAEATDEEVDNTGSGSGAIPIILAFILVAALSACSFLGSAANYLRDNVEITWDGNEVFGNGDTATVAPIDSIVIRFNSAYWKEDVAPTNIDSTYIESERDFNNGGYSVWTLQTPNWRRYEVRKHDTVIYIYPRKK